MEGQNVEDRSERVTIEPEGRRDNRADQLSPSGEPHRAQDPRAIEQGAMALENMAQYQPTETNAGYRPPFQQMPSHTPRPTMMPTMPMEAHLPPRPSTSHQQQYVRYAQLRDQSSLGAHSDNTQQAFIVAEIPRFKGRAKPGEVNFREGVNVRTFFRSLDNYFEHRNVTDDKIKVRIMFEHIDKESGDAWSVMDNFAGRKNSYKVMKDCFLNQYPLFTKTEFPIAATAVMGMNITQPTIHCGINALERTTRAFSEAYLNSPGMRESGVNMDTKWVVAQRGEDGRDRNHEGRLQKGIFIFLTLSLPISYQHSISPYITNTKSDIW